MYLDDVAAAIRGNIPPDRMPEGDLADLFRLYAVLLRAKGPTVTQSDVHDAWSAWMSQQNSQHPSLIPYTDLPDQVRQQDLIFCTAIQRAAHQLRHLEPARPSFNEILFPSGPPRDGRETLEALELYKIMVKSSEDLVNRRQAVNTFFLTINAALLTASGVVMQNAGADRPAALGIATLAAAGAILCLAWRSLITSFGQLNHGKFEVINSLERYFKAAIYAAEWEALGRGENPAIYRSFTSREIWVPVSLFVIHAVAVLVAGGVALGFVNLK